MTDDRIILEAMLFWGRHGTQEAERALGQPFEVTVELRCSLRAAGEHDDLGETVDYSAVYRAAKAIVEGEAVSLTETLAERIAAAVLRDHARVEAVCVRVRKPHVALGGPLAGSVIEIWRQRELGT